MNETQSVGWRSGEPGAELAGRGGGGGGGRSSILQPATSRRLGTPGDYKARLQCRSQLSSCCLGAPPWQDPNGKSLWFFPAPQSSKLPGLSVALLHILCPITVSQERVPSLPAARQYPRPPRPGVGELQGSRLQLAAGVWQVPGCRHRPWPQSPPPRAGPTGRQEWGPTQRT